MLPAMAILAAVCVLCFVLGHRQAALTLREHALARAVETLGQAALVVQERNELHQGLRLKALEDARRSQAALLAMLLAMLEETRARDLARGETDQARTRTGLAEAALAAGRAAGASVFIRDADNTLFAHSPPGLSGEALTAPPPSPERDGNGGHAASPHVIVWPDGESGHTRLASLGRFEPWGWTVGVSTDLAELEAQAQADARNTVEDVLKALSRPPFNQDGRLFVLRRESGEPLLAPPDLAVPLKAAAAALAAVEASPEAPERIRLPGRGDAAFLAVLPGTGLTVGFVAPSPEERAALADHDRRLGLGLAALLGAALLALRLLTRRVTAPLEALARNARQAVPAPPEQQDRITALRSLAVSPGEAGLLADALAHALDSLRQAGQERQEARDASARLEQALEETRSSLELLKQELEMRVSLRTSALEAANDRLKGSEARYRSLFISSPVPFLELDVADLNAFLDTPEVKTAAGQLERAGVDFLRDCIRLVSVKDANPAALALFGAPDRERLDRLLPDALHLDASPPFTALARALRQAGTHPDALCCIRGTGGLLRYAVLDLRPMPGYERTRERLLASLQDVTRLFEGEERLRAAHERLQAANKAKSEFLANMSHEIRTPLAAILGLAELSTRQADPAKTAQHLHMIADSAQTLLGIVGDVLDLSRVEAGRLVLDRKRLNPHEVVARAMAPFQTQCALKGLALSARLDQDVPEILLGDPIRLEQVLSNLIGNAVKFTDTGDIRVNVSLEGRRGRHLTVCFTVSDTGIGIEPGHTESIFDSFRQADSSFSKPYQGAGLGLAICRELTNLMGGSIEVESTPGAGSVFRFTAVLSLPGDASDEDGGAPGEAAGREGLDILVAEDNPHNRHVFKEFLTSLGHTVRAAGDGEEALRFFAEQPFDLAFMDVQMPRMDGLEAVRRLRAGDCGARAAATPVVALTAYAMSGDRERFLDAGMTDYLAKPLKLEALSAAVARHAGPRAHAPPEAQRPPEPAFDRAMQAETAAYLRERAEQAAGHLERGELDLAAQAAHDVKGTSMLFRFASVNEAGAVLLEAARTGDAQAALAAMARLLEVLDALDRALEAPGTPGGSG